MCGLFAVYNPSGLSRPSDLYRRGVAAIAHRGPDDEGVFEDRAAGVFIGHRRLSIVDPGPAGHQPMLTADGARVLAYNGQIYGHREHRPELLAAGAVFQSQSDTETLLYRLHFDGTDAFEKLRGMWALVSWDKRAKRLLVSRDRLGIKPLYIYRDPDGDICFASEIKAILAVYPKAATLNHVAAKRYLARGWIDDTQDTLFAPIQQIAPASWVTFEGGAGTCVERTGIFWELPAPEETRHDVDDLRAGFIDTVEAHLQSDVPVATTLSGGLDSGSITCVIAQTLGLKDQVQAFSVNLPDAPDESPWIDDAVRFSGIRHRYLDIGTVDVPAAMDRMIDQMDEPVFNTAYLYQNVLREMVRAEGYKVLLVGDGGDEVFGGYAKILPMFVESLLADGACRDARTALRGGSDLTGSALDRLVMRQRLLHRAGTGRRQIQEFRRGYDIFGEDGPDIDATLFPDRPHPQLDPSIPGRAFFQELFDRFTIDIPHHLRNEDRNAMAYGLESRPVFLDHRLIELAWTYPYRLFMEGGLNKALFRRAMNGLVTPSVLELRKKFVRPGNNTVTIYDQLGDRFTEMLSGARNGLDGLLRPGLASVFEADREARDMNHAYPWFRLYCLMRWADLKLSPAAS